VPCFVLMPCRFLPFVFFLTVHVFYLRYYYCTLCMYRVTMPPTYLPTYLLTQTCSPILVYPLLCTFFFFKSSLDYPMADMPDVRCTLIRASTHPRTHASSIHPRPYTIPLLSCLIRVKLSPSPTAVLPFSDMDGRFENVYDSG
jgi:hypothetical protein